MDLKELVHEPEELQHIASLNVKMLSALLSTIDADGKIGEDDAHVLTHHLLLVLSRWRNGCFDSIERSAVGWFGRLQDYREAKENDFNPFKLMAFASINREECKAYVAEKMHVLKKFKRTADGFIVLELGFVLAGDVQQVFPTLMGVNVLLMDGSEEALAISRDSLHWCRKQMNAGVVYQNTHSINGFAALMATEYERLSGDAQFVGWRNQLLSKLAESQEGGLWAGNRYQSSYVFYDLAHLCSLIENIDAKAALKNFIANFDDSYFEDPEVAGQNALIVLSSLLRGFSFLLSEDQQRTITATLVGGALQESSLNQMARRQYEILNEGLAERLKAFIEKRVIPINPRLFRERNAVIVKDQIFVLMPFGIRSWHSDGVSSTQQHTFDFDHYYDAVVKPTVEKLGFKCLRADSIFATVSFMEKIWTQILQSRLIIADVTSRNPNVMYELGMGHTLGKDIIIVTQSADDVPTDLKNVDFFRYSNEVGSEAAFRKGLTKAIKHVLGL